MALRTLLGGPRHDMSMVDGCNTNQGSKLPILVPQ
jgi:hypothetical protein